MLADAQVPGMQPEAVEYVLEPYKLYGPEFSFIQDLDCFLSEYDEGFVIPLQLGGQQTVMHSPFQHPPDSPECSQSLSLVSCHPLTWQSNGCYPDHPQTSRVPTMELWWRT